MIPETPRRLIALSAFVTLAAPFIAAAAPDGANRYFYSYFKEQVPLKCNLDKLAFFETPARTDVGVALAQRLADFGIPAEALTPTQTPGVWTAATNQIVDDADGVERMVASLATADAIGFVSPVFSDERGDPVIISQHLHVGFEADVTDQRAAEILADFTAGTIEARDWSDMSGVYRVLSNSRNGFEVLDLANRLAELPEVKFAEPDLLATCWKSLIPNDTFFSSLWGLHNTGQFGGTADMDMDAPEAWDVTTGSATVSVVVIDDGTQQNHPDIHQTPGNDLTGNGTGGGPLNQCDNHGTTVAGCVSAFINNSIGVVGIAPECQVAAAKYSISNVPCNGSGTFFISSFVNALGWAQTIGARVTNTSTSFGVSSSITTKYQQTRNAGLVHFSSSGNDGSSTIGYPANLPTVNAVGAISRTGNKASFSTYGTGLAFVAPGVSITTTDRTGNDGYVSGDYDAVDGTSYASPYAAGVAALIVSVDPALMPDDIELIMNSTCTDRGAGSYDTFYGWGIVNALGAVTLAGTEVFPPSAAASPYDRRKNRYLSFDPNKSGNDGSNVAFKVELLTINMGSCNDGTGGSVDFCRTDRGVADCNSCVGGAGGTCITTAIHCSTGGGMCLPTGALCANDAPNSGGSNVGQVWWVGPEHPSSNGVHLLVSQPFRKVSDDWPNPTHAGDCEVVPQATYGVRAVETVGGAESDELLIETVQFTPVAGPDPFWWADAIGSLVFHCNGDITLPTCTVATQVADCGVGVPCQRAWTLPNGAVNFDDVNAALTLVAPPGVGVPAEFTWVDLHGGAGDAPPNGIMNSSDLQQFIFGFGGFPYTGFDPADCPDVGTWP